MTEHLSSNIISKIILINFMCHSNTEINFSNRITCITGANGSGKSAFMIALGIVFGQSAKKLERGNSFKNLIKQNETSATIIVHINNIYKIPEFDEKIILIKKIYKDKPNRFSIRKNNSYVDFKKNDLELFIRLFGLNFTNPINFLTQDNSKKILNVSNSNDLYNFYYEGSEFKNIEEEIQEGEKLVGDMNQKLKHAYEKKSEIEKIIVEKQVILNFVSTNFQELLQQIDREEKWIDVFELDSQKKHKKEEANVLIEKITENKLILNELQSKTSIFVPKDVTELNKKIDEIDKALQETEHEYERMENEYQQKKDIIENAKLQNNKSILLDKFQKLKAENDELMIKKTTLEEKYTKLQINILEEKKLNAQLIQERETTLHQINILKQNNKNTLKEAFIHKFDEVKKIIHNTVFKDQIIGPICDHIFLKNKKWSIPVSIILKKTLESFIVFNHDDKMQLSYIFKKYNVIFPILQLSSKTIIQPTIHTNYTTVLNIIDIDIPIIRNILIVWHNIEDILLMDDRQKAFDIAQKEEKNINSIYLHTGDRIKCFNGNLSDYREKEFNFYYFEDLNDKIKTLEKKVNNIRLKNEYIQEEKGIALQLEKINAKLIINSKEIKVLEMELNSYDMVKDENLNKLERKLIVLNKQRDCLKSKRDHFREEKMKLILEKKNIINDNNIKKIKYKKIEDERTTDINRYKNNITNYEKELKDIEENIRNIDTIVQEKRNVLLKESKEIPIVSTRDVIQEKKARIYSDKNRVETMDNKDAIQDQITKLNCELKNLLKIQTNFTDTIYQTVKCLEERKIKRDEIKYVKTLDTINLFKYYTEIHGYTGNLEFDHSNKKLDITVGVHDNLYKGSKNTLSGGERSFAGICFLLSLWSIFHCPIKILDEFDVFMDSINRKNAIKQLCTFSQKHNTQIILITPLDMQDVREENIDIIYIEKYK